MDSIHVITSIHIGGTVQKLLCVTRKRTVGWFPTLARAVEAVTNNEGDLYEAGHYDHCVIEEVQVGLYPSIGRKEYQERWFKWKLDRYILIDKPNVLKDIHNFCNMG
jgi:hypothetical protein